ncbi:MAG TPA: DNA polymerase III subunit delta [Allosphingosinicella sp.]|nr:DNA polymerase III subunit delta [Allosphingosinicella sp.]
MKANRPQLDKALQAPADTRFFLFHGQDEAGSRALAKAVGGALGGEAERIDLSASELKADPARLADEAASISMFGGARWILVEPADDGCAGAVEALLEAPVAGNPVALVAGALKPASALLKLALAAPGALAFASYTPDAREADRLAQEMARTMGLGMNRDVAHRVAEASGGNRAIIEQELAKFALYLGATPESPREADHDVVDALGAAADEGDLSKLVEHAMGGDAAGLEAELARLRAEGMEGIVLIRAMLRRMALLARLRADVEQGSSPSAVMTSAGKALFWKEKPVIEIQLRRWRSELIGKAMTRLSDAERQLKASGGPGPIAADEELFAICRQAARLR